MRYPPLGWRWVAPDGRTGAVERTPARAAEAAILHALSAKRGAELDRDTKQKLWRSLKAQGWTVEEIRP